MLLNIFGLSGSGKTKLIKDLISTNDIFSIHSHFFEIATDEKEDKNISISLLPLGSFRGTIKSYFQLFGLNINSCLRSKELIDLYKSINKDFIDEKDLIVNRLFETLSAGEQRRLNIARALAFKCEMVVIDEPFCNSDESLYQIIFNSILNSSKSIIISHAPLDDKILEYEEELCKSIHINIAKNFFNNLNHEN